MNTNDLLYLPESSRVDEISKLASIYDTVGDACMHYLSTPMTTGRRLLNFLEEGFALSVAKSLSMSLNIKDANDRAVALGDLLKRPVINPTGFFIEGWEQEDYLHFWGTVITKHVKSVLMMPDWQYSQGASYEYYVATFHGLPVRDAMTLDRIHVSQALGMIEGAAKEQALMGTYYPIQRRVIAELTKRV